MRKLLQTLPEAWKRGLWLMKYLGVVDLAAAKPSAWPFFDNWKKTLLLMMNQRYHAQAGTYCQPLIAISFAQL